MNRINAFQLLISVFLIGIGLMQLRGNGNVGFAVLIFGFWSAHELIAQNQAKAIEYRLKEIERKLGDKK